mmetsp:Transcript_47406/g.95527  ORF Transcript_47406/g.95527 Transcript_47406/m.95527 type:complete len:204 (-) Transcript_47406:837-1448(-)
MEDSGFFWGCRYFSLATTTRKVKEDSPLSSTRPSLVRAYLGRAGSWERTSSRKERREDSKNTCGDVGTGDTAGSRAFRDPGGTKRSPKRPTRTRAACTSLGVRGASSLCGALWGARTVDSRCWRSAAEIGPSSFSFNRRALARAAHRVSIARVSAALEVDPAVRGADASPLGASAFTVLAAPAVATRARPASWYAQVGAASSN